MKESLRLWGLLGPGGYYWLFQQMVTFNPAPSSSSLGALFFCFCLFLFVSCYRYPSPFITGLQNLHICE